LRGIICFWLNTKDSEDNTFSYENFENTWTDLILRLSYIENIPARVIDELVLTLTQMVSNNLQHLRHTFQQKDVPIHLQDLMFENFWLGNILPFYLKL